MCSPSPYPGERGTHDWLPFFVPRFPIDSISLMLASIQSEPLKKRGSMIYFPYPVPTPVSTENIVKIIVVGDSGTGKQHFIQRFVTDTFDDKKNETRISEWEIKKYNGTIDLFVKIPENKRFMDIPGRDYQGAHAAILVCDSADPVSFKQIPLWYQEVRRFCYDEIPVFLVATKCDNLGKRCVTQEELNTVAKDLKLNGVAEVSAKSGGENSSKIFDLAISTVINSRKKPTLIETPKPTEIKRNNKCIIA